MTNSNGRIVAEFTTGFNKDEFVEVYRCLYSSDIFKKRWGVDRVTAWESRCSPIPVTGVDATVVLVRAQIHDELYQKRSSLCQPSDIQSMYATGLVRFVNTVTESKQPHDKAISVHLAARRCSIPAWIVDLRHNVCHSHMPSVHMLRCAAEMALNWLKVEFWEKELAHSIDYIFLSDGTEGDAEQVILNFQEIQFASRKSKSAAKKYANEFRRAVRSFDRCLSAKGAVFFNSLLLPSYFFLSNDVLLNVLSPEEYCFMREPVLELPPSLILFWKPIIKVINDLNMMTEFVEHLFLCQKKLDDINKRIANAWAVELIQHGAREGEEPDTEKSPLASMFNEDKLHLNWHCLMAACAKSISIYTPYVLPSIMDYVVPPLTIGQKNHLMALIAMYLGSTVPTQKELTKRVMAKYEPKTAATIKRDREIRESAKRQKLVLEEEDVWQLTTDMCSKPLGQVFGSPQKFVINIQEKVQDFIVTEPEANDLNPPNEVAAISEQEQMEISEEIACYAEREYDPLIITPY